MPCIHFNHHHYHHQFGLLHNSSPEKGDHGGVLGNENGQPRKQDEFYADVCHENHREHCNHRRDCRRLRGIYGIQAEKSGWGNLQEARLVSTIPILRGRTSGEVSSVDLLDEIIYRDRKEKRWKIQGINFPSHPVNMAPRNPRGQGVGWALSNSGGFHSAWGSSLHPKAIFAPFALGKSVPP